jgi:TolA-binding protein
VLRFLFGLLAGVLVGVGGTAYFFSSGGGDYLINSSPRVLRLEEDLRRLMQEREQLTKEQKEIVERVEDQIDTRLKDLESRFQKLESLTRKPASPEGPQEGVSEGTGGTQS